MGSGKTTRSNVDALLSDIIDSVDEATIALVYDKTPSDGATWAKQFAEEKELPVLIYEGNNYPSLLAEVPREDVRFFMLWDDDDPECQLAASIAQENALPSYDLTDGLIRIPFNSEPIVRPQVAVIPLVETVVSDPAVEAAAAIAAALALESVEIAEEDNLEDEEVSEEYDLPELVSLMVEQAGKDLARAFFDEFKKLLDK
jgi:hypothetical protein